MTEPWQEDEVWMDENVCDFCGVDFSESPYQETIELAYTNDQPPVQMCSSCLVEGTLKWQKGDFDKYRDQDVTERVLKEIYGRGLDIKVDREDRPDALKLGEIPD